MWKDLPERIVVIDQNNKYISHTHPARVRKLLKQGRAEVFSIEPFSVRLKGERGKIMKPVTNFTKYFSGEERDVYVMNVSNTQVSMQFETSPNHFDFVLIPRTRRPFNLTQHIPFGAIKQSTDLRRLVNRRPPALQLLTAEEFEAYYDKLAVANGTSRDEEINIALELQANLMDKRAVAKEEVKPKTIDELKNERAEDPSSAAEEQPLPRVIGLCAQVGPHLEKEEKLSAGEMMSELEAIEDELRPTDYEYIASNGFHPSIKKWANKRYGESVPSEEATE